MSEISKIGRFKIIRKISREGQDAAYLAEGAQFEPQVVVKVLHITSPAQKENLMREVRAITKLQHPNIVALYETGEHEGFPFFVYPFIEGDTLSQLLKRSGALSAEHSAQLLAGVLDGLAYAHQQGVAHHDIKASKVILKNNNQPMLLDFAIARYVGKQSPLDGNDAASKVLPSDSLDFQRWAYQSDIYSAGILLREMTSGIDDQLESIIIKALAKKPEDHYSDAQAMRQALLNYLDASPDKVPYVKADSYTKGDDESVLEFLMKRMSRKADFPAISGIISEINKIVASESESHRKLAQVILQDFALTNKIIKLVNTASFVQFGGKINTISKAVVILGFDTIRNVATSLILLEFMQNKSQAIELKDEILAALIASIMAEKLAGGGGLGYAEEAMICAMYHNLGRLLATYYFIEESREVVRLMEEQKISEAQASIRVLGISYDELGVGVALKWNFPSRLREGMRKLPVGKVSKAHDEIEQLNITANLVNELCKISLTTDVKQKTAELHRLSMRYDNAISLSEHKLAALLETGLSVLSKRSGILGVASEKSILIKKIRNWIGYFAPIISEQVIESVTLPNSVKVEANAQSVAQLDQETMLNAGIQDVTNTLVEDYMLNDVLYMVLETIYRSLGFRHSLIFIRDNKQHAMIAKFGFGENIDEILPQLKFSLNYVPDVFHLAIDKGLDIVIDNVYAEIIADKIPSWYLESIDAQCFLLLPIMVNKKAFGLLYADMQKPDSLNLSERQLSLLRTLRNQAVLAIKTKLL